MEAKLDRARHPDFDPTFRDQLQALLAWRRDVRRFRRDALPQGHLMDLSPMLLERITMQLSTLNDRFVVLKQLMRNREDQMPWQAE